jgi:hypothetical protein
MQRGERFYIFKDLIIIIMSVSQMDQKDKLSVRQIFEQKSENRSCLSTNFQQ